MIAALWPCREIAVVSHTALAVVRSPYRWVTTGNGRINVCSVALDGDAQGSFKGDVDMWCLIGGESR